MRYEPLHHQIKAAREARKLSVPEVAKLAGLAQNTVYRAERGEPIATDNLFAILSVLRVEIRLVRRSQPNLANKLKATGEAAA